MVDAGRNRLALQRLLAGLALFLAHVTSSVAAPACQPHSAPMFPGIEALAQTWRADAHPLAGSVWHKGSWYTRRADGSPEMVCGHHPLFEVLHDSLQVIKSGGHLLLGEVHDNAGHHALRAEIIAAHSWLVTSAEGAAPVPSPGVVLEHVRADQQPILDDVMRVPRNGSAAATVSELFTALQWNSSGWPDKALFEPLFAAAIGARLPAYAGDAPRDLIRKAAREGETALPPEERMRLGLDRPLGPRLHDALLDELEASHCGLMPKSAFGAMAFAQRYRDAHLADAMLKAGARHGAAILLAGNGHVRGDRGVALYLRQRAPNRVAAAVMLVEVEEGRADPDGYIPRDPDGNAVADTIVLTPRVPRADPCQAMRAQMRGRKG